MQRKTIGSYTYLVNDFGDLVCYAPDETPSATPSTDRPAKRGRPAGAITSTPNPLYALISEAADLGLPWLEDIVYGACVTSGGVSNGKMNCCPRHVLRTLTRPSISIETVGFGLGCSLRAKQRTAQVARHALGGIELYLERNPEVRSRLENLATRNNSKPLYLGGYELNAGYN
ncbi:hypothetical protein SAMN05216206_2581 [Pseudomonas guineae]|uniref:Uncharacterized protein n=1 Tax=Pseudomonas guineae TaxID=425504 RepID=A0A1I3JRG8_9PSED|nr:hypothetical protein SAMN05216206_2581 [Pseudomonas guineae]